MNNFFMRKLASIQIIKDIRPIVDAHSIEIADVLGWHCVIRKAEGFKVGDLCVYIQIDSVVPDESWSDFLRDRKFRVRTIKLRKQISEGLVLPLNILYGKLSQKAYEKLKEGSDVTDILGVKLWEPYKKPVRLYKKQKADMTFWEKVKEWWYQKTYWRKRKKNIFPTWLVPKTSETRIQNSPSILKNHQGDLCSHTEKIDGCSGTYIIHKGKFIVCSRNLRVKNGGYNSNIYWKVAENDGIEEKLRLVHKNIAIQGEIIGPNGMDSGVGVKNKYNRPELELYVFNVYDIDKKEYLNYFDFLEFTKKYKLRTVPNLGHVTLPDGEKLVDQMVEFAEGMSVINPKHLREGLVVRSRDMHSGRHNFSFKVLSQKFKLIKSKR